jgi:DNA-binding transcriptional LysR family regulator
MGEGLPQCSVLGQGEIHACDADARRGNGRTVSLGRRRFATQTPRSAPTRSYGSTAAAVPAASSTALRQGRIRPRERWEVDALETIAIMVDRGLGVALVPDWAPPWPEGLSLRKLSVPNQAHPRYNGLVWNRASLRIRLAQTFLEVAMATLAEPPDNSSKRKGSRAVRRQ